MWARLRRRPRPLPLRAPSSHQFRRDFGAGISIYHWRLQEEERNHTIWARGQGDTATACACLIVRDSEIALTALEESRGIEHSDRWLVAEAASAAYAYALELQRLDHGLVNLLPLGLGRRLIDQFLDRAR